MRILCLISLFQFVGRWLGCHFRQLNNKDVPLPNCFSLLTQIRITDPVRAKPTPKPRSASLVRRPSSATRPMPPSALPAVLMDLEATGPPDRTYKVVFAGDAAVGKTSFINRKCLGFC